LGFAVIVSAPVFAGAQQEKMKGCNIEAKGMKGDERRAFMSKCLKKDYTLKSAGAAANPEAKPAAKADEKPEAKPATSAAAPAAAPVKQQDKMKSCNEDAKTKALKGEERKAFMKSCLKS
jgi:hypothetical protein